MVQIIQSHADKGLRPEFYVLPQAVSAHGLSQTMRTVDILEERALPAAEPRQLVRTGEHSGGDGTASPDRDDEQTNDSEPLRRLADMRILIADDSLVSRHLLEATLRRWSYEVIVASDGLQAWDVLRGEDPPRLAILDWVMPGLTGLDVCKRVREHAKNEELNYTYLLLLTSKNEREDMIEGMEAGADDYLAKPFDPLELKVRLRAGSRVIDLQRQLVSAREELREQATKDFLTRVWNRSSILDILQRELARGAREKRSVGVVLADLDQFKSVNDTFGHFAGDAVLREFVRRASSAIRPYDSIGRYGGEEFLIVLPGCDQDCTSTQAERIRIAVAADRMLIEDKLHTQTSSFGATWWQPGMEMNADALIRVADDALYMAKKEGRNRTVVIPPKSLQAQER
ncbi:MAG: diguanylate cyclase [Acidobacteriota bacterium]